MFCYYYFFPLEDCGRRLPSSIQEIRGVQNPRREENEAFYLEYSRVIYKQYSILYRYTVNIYCEELYPRVIRDRPRVLYIGDPDLEHCSDSCISDLR